MLVTVSLLCSCSLPHTPLGHKPNGGHLCCHPLSPSMSTPFPLSLLTVVHSHHGHSLALPPFNILYSCLGVPLNNRVARLRRRPLVGTRVWFRANKDRGNTWRRNQPTKQPTMSDRTGRGGTEGAAPPSEKKMAQRTMAGQRSHPYCRGLGGEKAGTVKQAVALLVRLWICIWWALKHRSRHARSQATR